MPKDIFVVVVSYNGLENTQKCVLSLLDQDASIRVLVWDNASIDGTREWLASQNDVEYHLSDDNVLWTPAINEAIKNYHNGEPNICFMNNDILIDSHVLGSLSRTLEKSEVGLVAPVGSSLGGVQDYASHQDTYTEYGPEIRVNYVVGALCLIRHDVWEKVGILDPTMPLGADDHDYSIRIKHAGLQVIVRSDVYVNHIGHATGDSGNWNDFGSSSWKTFEEKWSGYYATEEEAIESHWGNLYNDKFPVGTGWSEDKYKMINERLLNAT